MEEEIQAEKHKYLTKVKPFSKVTESTVLIKVLPFSLNLVGFTPRLSIAVYLNFLELVSLVGMFYSS
jgi:hypothetical protein